MLGLIFVILSNYFRILAPQVTGYVVNTVEKELTAQAHSKTSHPITVETQIRNTKTQKADTANYDILVKKFIRKLNSTKRSFGQKVAISGITLSIASSAAFPLSPAALKYCRRPAN